MNILPIVRLHLFNYSSGRLILSLYFLVFKPQQAYQFFKELINVSDHKNLKRCLNYCLKKMEFRPELLAAVIRLESATPELHSLILIRKKHINECLQKWRSSEYSFLFNDFTGSSKQNLSRAFLKVGSGEDDIQFFLEAYKTAISNFYAYLTPDEYIVCNPRRGTMSKLKDMKDMSEVTVVGLPAYLLTEKNGSDILMFFDKSISVLNSLDANFVYLIQHWPFFINPIQSRTISYHTIGNNENHLHIKESAFRGYFTIDSSGYSGWHSINSIPNLSNDIDTYDLHHTDAFYSKLYEQFVVKKISKYEQPNNHLQLPKNYIFLPLQVYNDSVAQHAYINTIDLLDSMISICIKKNLNLVIKPHPLRPNPQIIRKLKEASTHPLISVAEGNIHNLISNAKLVVTVNSGVGFESLLHLKTIITTGKSEYFFATKTAKDKFELEEILDSGYKSNPENLKRFLYYYFNKFLYSKEDDKKLLTLFSHFTQQRESKQ